MRCSIRTLSSSRPNEPLSAPLTALAGKRVTWIGTTRLPGCFETRRGESIANPCEVVVVEDLLRNLAEAATADGRRVEVAVLSGYRAQCSLLEARLRPADLGSIDLTVATVDAFQGREAEVVIYSVTRANRSGKLGFARERPRVNVALSRARELLVIVGHQDSVRRARGENSMAEVIAYVEANPGDCDLTEAAITARDRRPSRPRTTRNDRNRLRGGGPALLVHPSRCDVLAKKPISVIHETVMNAISLGVQGPSELQLLLGLDDFVFQGAAVGLLSEGWAEGAPDQPLALTEAGMEVLESAVEIVSEERVVPIYYDGLVRRPIASFDNGIKPKRAQAEGIREIPPTPAHPPDIRELRRSRGELIRSFGHSAVVGTKSRSFLRSGGWTVVNGSIVRQPPFCWLTTRAGRRCIWPS